MPKLPSLTPQKIIKVLEKRGFVLDRIKGSHHIYYHPEMKRRKRRCLRCQVSTFDIPNTSPDLFNNLLKPFVLRDPYLKPST